MSKGSKQQYKQFAIRIVEDVCIVLKGLIILVIVNLEKFREYSEETEKLFDSLPNKPCMITDDGLSQEVQYVEHKVNESTPKKSGSCIAASSMGIQKGKYDGSGEM